MFKIEFEDKDGDNGRCENQCKESMIPLPLPITTMAFIVVFSATVSMPSVAVLTIYTVDILCCRPFVLVEVLHNHVLDHQTQLWMNLSDNLESFEVSPRGFA
jgi:hypothetical protein